MSQGNVVCVKCGAPASSKCPVCRNVFPLTSVSVDLFRSHVACGGGTMSKNSMFDSEQKDFVVAMDWGLAQNGDTEYDLVANMNLLASSWAELTDEEKKQAVCKHDWVFCDGAESTIGCGHGSK